MPASSPSAPPSSSSSSRAAGHKRPRAEDESEEEEVAPSPLLRARIEALILSMAKARAEKRAGSTLCPSEVARAISPAEATWRPLMPLVREVAGDLVRRGSSHRPPGEPGAAAAAPAGGGRLAVTQRGVEVDIAAAKGPVRLRWVEEG
jgi:hypothetical protein